MEKIKTNGELLEEKRQNSILLIKDLFAEKLKDLRDEKKLSQKNVANQLGVAVSTYANWEQGRREPSIYDILNLTWVFEIEANELFDFDIIHAHKNGDNYIKKKPSK